MNALLPIDGNLPHGTALVRLEGIRTFGDDEVLDMWVQSASLRSAGTARHYSTQSSKFRLFLELIHPEWEPNTHLQMAREADVKAFEYALSVKDMPDGKPRILTLTPEQMAKHGLKTQPFERALQRSSINQALTVLNAMYGYLSVPNESMPEPYVRFNPVKKQRRSKSRTLKQIDRHITLKGIQAMHAYLLSAIESATQQTKKAEVAKYERLLWIFTLLFGLWGRREEICRLSMGHFRQKHGSGWEVSLYRKGRGLDAEEIQAASWVIEGLRRYRASIGLPRAWAKGDPTPAIQTLRLAPGERPTHINSQTLYAEVKRLASETAKEIELGRLLPDISEGEREDLLGRLHHCSPHWFRHTGPTIAINDKSITIVLASKMLGHTNVTTTTDMYFHGDKVEIQTGLDALGAHLKAPSTTTSP